MTTDNEVESLRAELEQMRAQLNASINPAEDSLQQALREFAAQNEREIPGARMTAPCQHRSPDGRQCGILWKQHPLPGRNGHSYRDYPMPQPMPAQPGVTYQRDPLELAAPEEPTSIYVSLQDAASALGATLPQIRKLIKAGTLVADTIGKTVLVRTVSLQRLRALRALAQGDETIAYAQEDAG